MADADLTLPLLLEPEDFAPLLQSPPNNLLIVDLSQAQVYQRAHVPGAVHLPFSRLVSGVKPTTGALPSEHHLAQVFSEFGLTPESHVIAYDDEGGGWAGRLIWTLDVLGHRKYSYLNGGIQAWIGANLPIEKTVNLPQERPYQVAIDPSVIADKDYILENLGNENMVIWDARSLEEYLGTRAFAQRAGHIPGAKHFEWTAGMDRERHLRVIDLEQLRAQLATLGISADKEIITHCQTHHRSGFTYLLGKILQFPNIKAYPGSWSEWGNLPDTPTEQGES